NGIHKKKLVLDHAMYLLVIRVCTNIRNIEEKNEIHNMINNNEDDVKKNIKGQNALSHVYEKCCDIINAEIIFNNIKEDNVNTFNVLMKGHNFNELPKTQLII
ncbi:unnamed protein product, partial [Didymodactylos carnosus]